MPGLQIGFIGGELRRIALKNSLAGKLDSQRFGYSCRDFILHGKDVAQFAVISL